MTEPRITFPGRAFAELSNEQQLYVSHCMWSWRACTGMWFDRSDLLRAIKKARNNLP